MPTGSLWAYREEGGPHALRLQLLQGKGQCPYKGWSPVPCITHRTRSGRPRSCGAWCGSCGRGRGRWQVAIAHCALWQGCMLLIHTC